MDKIHTHYDNLKVARMAPPEVIRAAYKALSQKYHPDKNPGDEKAARIMAILNTAYSTLSDEQRRKEHDAWITAEEWEVEWLESEGKGKDAVERWDAPDGKHQQIVRYRPSRDPKWWAIVVGCLGVGWGSGAMMVAKPGLLSAMFAFGHKPAVESVEESFVTEIEPGSSRIITVSEFRMPELACSSDVRPPQAPSGKAWPIHSGYVNGYKVGNLGGSTQLTIDNSHNDQDVFVKLFDIEKNVYVRYALLKAHERFTMEQLKTGNYELRHQVWGSTPCEGPVAAVSNSSDASSSLNSSSLNSSSLSSSSAEVALDQVADSKTSASK